ncbi:MAG: hypothetical protein GY861_11080 [bacterium]|nr:hypothetical protein [bacterium]
MAKNKKRKKKSVKLTASRSKAYRSFLYAMAIVGGTAAALKPFSVSIDSSDHLDKIIREQKRLVEIVKPVGSYQKHLLEINLRLAKWEANCIDEGRRPEAIINAVSGILFDAWKKMKNPEKKWVENLTDMWTALDEDVVGLQNDDFMDEASEICNNFDEEFDKPDSNKVDLARSYVQIVKDQVKGDTS